MTGQELPESNCPPTYRQLCFKGIQFGHTTSRVAVGRHILPDWPWEIYAGPAFSHRI